MRSSRSYGPGSRKRHAAVPGMVVGPGQEQGRRLGHARRARGVDGDARVGEAQRRQGEGPHRGRPPAAGRGRSPRTPARNCSRGSRYRLCSRELVTRTSAPARASVSGRRGSKKCAPGHSLTPSGKYPSIPTRVVRGTWASNHRPASARVSGRPRRTPCQAERPRSPASSVSVSTRTATRANGRSRTCFRRAEERAREQDRRRGHQVDEEALVDPRNGGGRQEGRHEERHQDEVREVPAPDGHPEPDAERQERGPSEPVPEQREGARRAVPDRRPVARDEPPGEGRAVAGPGERRQRVSRLEHAHLHQDDDQERERRERHPGRPPAAPGQSERDGDRHGHHETRRLERDREAGANGGAGVGEGARSRGQAHARRQREREGQHHGDVAVRIVRVKRVQRRDRHERRRQEPDPLVERTGAQDVDRRDGQRAHHGREAREHAPDQRRSSTPAGSPPPVPRGRSPPRRAS